MSIETRLFVRKSRSLVGALVASAVLVTTLGVSVSSVGASTSPQAASSAFCKTVEGLGAIKAPSTGNFSSYKQWLKRYLPTYEKLASEAPNASVKRVLNQLVTLMKYESNAGAAIKLDQYIAKNEKQWVKDWQSFTKSVISCVTSIQLP